jgi:hypothetical protein
LLFSNDQTVLGQIYTKAKNFEEKTLRNFDSVKKEDQQFEADNDLLLSLPESEHVRIIIFLVLTVSTNASFYIVLPYISQCSIIHRV